LSPNAKVCVLIQSGLIFRHNTQRNELQFDTILDIRLKRCRTINLIPAQKMAGVPLGAGRDGESSNLKQASRIVVHHLILKQIKKISKKKI